MDAELKRLQGRWDIIALEIEGQRLPEGGFREARIVVKGNTFTTVSMGAEYGGTIAVDASKTPKSLDMSFATGPEKGTKSLAIYELEGDTWKLCLTVTGKTRPKEFATRPGSGHAFEILKRRNAPDPRERLLDELAVLQGTWSLVTATRNGEPMPPQAVKTGKRVVAGNETTVLFAGHVYLKAAFTLDPAATPKTIDYIVTAGEGQGQAQAGLYAIDGDTVTYCLAAPGAPRPKSISAGPGPGGVLTVWTREKPARKGSKKPAK